MGGAQSRTPERTLAPKLAEQLMSLDITEPVGQQSLEKEYYFVGKDDGELHRYMTSQNSYTVQTDGTDLLAARPQTSGSQTVSISTAEEWEKEVMEDSKVAIPHSMRFDHTY